MKNDVSFVILVLFQFKRKEFWHSMTIFSRMVLRISWSKFETHAISPKLKKKKNDKRNKNLVKLYLGRT